PSAARRHRRAVDLRRRDRADQGRRRGHAAAVAGTRIRRPRVRLARLPLSGRVILGVGVGGEVAKDFEAVGVPVRERGARTDEAMRALRELFSGRPASFGGRFFAFEEISIRPATAQPGGPPLWVGGRSDAAIRRAAQLADGWMPLWVSPERYAEGLARVREGGR